MIGRAVKDLGTAVLQMGESSSVASSWRQEAGAALPEASVPAHSLRPLCSSYRLGLARRLARLDRSGHYELKRSEASPEMFDFQESAARWLVRRFEIAQGYSLLEMAAGCGKTRALGAFLAAALPPSELCLYITQAGLVRQTCAELQRVFPRLPCFRAESSKDLKKMESRGGVLVVNAAISRAWLPLTTGAWAVIVDEAHRASGLFLMRLARRCGRSSKLVLSSGTPSASGSLSTLALQATDEQHFVLLKTASVAEALCMPRIVLVDRSYTSPSVVRGDVAEALDYVRRNCHTAVSSLVIGLALSKIEPEEPLFLEEADRTWAQICAMPSLERQRHYIRHRLWHPALHDIALQFGERTSTLMSNAERDSFLRLLEPPAPVLGRQELCACCGLREEEVRLLQTSLAHALPPPERLLPEDWGLDESPFVRAVLRLPDARSVREYCSCMPKGSLRSLCIFSELTAAQRAKRVACFVKPQESPCALAMLLRRGFGDRFPASAVADIGGGELLRRIVAFVADRAVLVCDARCGDVGYNLQLSTHILAPLLPRDAEEVQQLCGRAHRICANRRPIVQLVCCPRRRTGEVFLLRHLCRGLDFGALGSF